MSDAPDKKPEKEQEDTGETFFAGDQQEDMTLPTMKHRKELTKGDVILNRYRITGQLGRGGMGIVYRCYDDVGGIDVAVKTVPIEVARNVTEMEEIRKNFQLIEKLHHPNIAAAKTLEKDPETGAYYLIMECAEGINLRRFRKKSGEKLTLEQAVPILKQVASALDYAHSQKIIHRDIKPGNIMISDAGTAKVLDFGIASQLQETLTRMSHIHFETSGTTAYMAPEQWRGQYQNSATDQYALAVVTYELLSGRLPFSGQNVEVLCQAVLNEPPEPIPGLAHTTWKTIAKALAKNRSERFTTCDEFIQALEGAPAVKKAPSIRLPRRYRTAAAIFLLACLGALAIVPIRQRMKFNSYYEQAMSAKKDKNWARLRQFCDVALNLRPGDERILTLLNAIPKRGHLEVTSDPSGAKVWFRGEPLGATPCVLRDLPAGKGLLVLRLADYEAHENEVLIPVNAKVKRHAVFSKQPASIRVTTMPAGAAVWINGHLQNEATPLVVSNLSGRMVIKIEKDGFRSVERNIDVESGERVEVEFGDLTARQGRVRIKSLPLGATVWLDGEQKGKTPLDLPQVLEGEYEVVLRLERYENHSARITLKDRAIVDETYVLKAMPAMLAVRSEPFGAEVTINGVRTEKTTPCAMPVAPGRLVFVTVNLEGYGSQSKQIRPEPGSSQSVDFTLEKLSGRIRITGIPAGSEILLDGKSAGTTVTDEFHLDDVAIGDHVVNIRKKGYDDIPPQNVSVSGGAVSAVSFAQYLNASVSAPEEEPKETVETTSVKTADPGRKEAPDPRIEGAGTIHVVSSVPRRFKGKARGRIIINGRNLGICALPYTIKNVKPGAYTIELVGELWKEGASRTVRVSDSSDVEVTVFFKSKGRWLW